MTTASRHDLVVRGPSYERVVQAGFTVLTACFGVLVLAGMVEASEVSAAETVGLVLFIVVVLAVALWLQIRMLRSRVTAPV